MHLIGVPWCPIGLSVARLNSAADIHGCWGGAGRRGCMHRLVVVCVLGVAAVDAFAVDPGGGDAHLAEFFGWGGEDVAVEDDEVGEGALSDAS